MKILVTGANGFIGKALCETLKTEMAQARIGEAIELIKCSRNPDYGSVAVGEISAYNGWEELMRGVDVVIHLAARVHHVKDKSSDPTAEYQRDNVQTTQILLESAKKANVSHFMFLSTIAVMGYNSGDTPMKASHEAPYSHYSHSKLAAEAKVRSSGISHTIIRIPLTYGAGVRANFRSLIKMVDKRLPFPLAQVRNARNLLYVGNLCDAIVQLLSLKVRPQMLLLADDESPSTPKLIQNIATALGKKPLLIAFPDFILKLAAKLVGKPLIYHQLCSSLCMDLSETSQQLQGWSPPFSQQQGLEATIADYSSRI